MAPHDRLRSESTTAGVDPGILHKVRSLLAKAESTGFAEEAESLTAKAQQLMDRHAIDRAMLAADAPGTSAGPEGRRITIEAPYARREVPAPRRPSPGANRSRAVLSAHAGFATVVGFPDDQETIELLYTSLLVQATTGMLARGDRPATRTRRYRQSFLVAFAARIGERLREADDEVVAEADRAHGGAVVPVLASRAAAVEAHLAREFPHLRSRPVVRPRRGGVGGRHRGGRSSARLGSDGGRGRDRSPVGASCGGNMAADG